MNKKFLACIVSVASVCHFAIAASPKDPQQVQITGLNPITLGHLQPFGTGTKQEQTFCVYSSSRHYNVTVTTPSNKLEFPAMTGSTSIPFQVFWDDQANGSNPQPLTINLPLKFTKATDVIGCNNTNNSFLRVVIPDANLNGVKSGNYQIPLTITVSWTN